MKSYLSNNFNLNDFVNLFDELPLWSALFGLKLLPPDNIEQIFDTIESRLYEWAKEQCGIKLTILFVLINAIKK